MIKNFSLSCPFLEVISKTTLEMLREENEKNMHSMGMGSKVLFMLFGMQDIYISGFANLPKLLSTTYQGHIQQPWILPLDYCGCKSISCFYIISCTMGSIKFIVRLGKSLRNIT